MLSYRASRLKSSSRSLGAVTTCWPSWMTSRSRPYQLNGRSRCRDKVRQPAMLVSTVSTTATRASSQQWTSRICSLATWRSSPRASIINSHREVWAVIRLVWAPITPRLSIVTTVVKTRVVQAHTEARIDNQRRSRASSQTSCSRVRARSRSSLPLSKTKTTSCCMRTQWPWLSNKPPTPIISLQRTMTRSSNHRLSLKNNLIKSRSCW